MGFQVRVCLTHTYKWVANVVLLNLDIVITTCTPPADGTTQAESLHKHDASFVLLLKLSESLKHTKLMVNISLKLSTVIPRQIRTKILKGFNRCGSRRDVKEFGLSHT